MVKTIHNVDNKTLEKINMCFVQLFIGYLLLSRVVIVEFLVGDRVNTLIATAFAMAGIVLLIVRIMKKGTLLIDKYVIVLLSFIVVTIISSLLNYQYGIFGNVKMIIWLIIQYIFLFGLSKDENTYRELMYKKIGKVVVLIMGTTAFVSIVQFLFEINYKIVLQDYPRKQGFVDGRLYGVFDDPNFASLAAIAALAFSFYFFTKNKKKSFRFFNILNIVLQFIFIILSNSRTGMVALFLCTFIIAFYYAENIRKKEKWIKGLVVFSGLVILQSGVIIGGRISLNYLPNLIHAKDEVALSDESKLTEVEKDEGVKSEQKIDKEIQSQIETPSSSEKTHSYLERNDIATDYSNSRFDIWRGALYVSKEHRILGLSPRNILSYAKVNFPNDYTAQTGYETHNGYLSLLVCGGFLSVLIMIWFIISCIVVIFKSRFKGIQDLTSFMIIASFAFGALTLQDIFYNNNFTTVLFWIILGMYIYEHLEKGNSLSTKK